MHVAARLAFSLAAFSGVALAALAATGAGCGSAQGGSGFTAPPSGADADGGTGDGSVAADDDGSAGLVANDASEGQCVNLQCKQVSCGGGAETTVSGTVYDPAGKTPLYNAIVYVPNSTPAPFTSGATCDQCGVMASGDPIVSAITDTHGRFTLKHVPVGKDIPLVVQIGKFRRQVKIPNVDACKDNPITDKDLTRLPRNRSEGDLPQMALTTGGCDALECLFRKIGIDDAEFTPSTGNGRMHLYQGYEGATIPGITDAQPFWSDEKTLEKYDIVLLSCECAPHAATKPKAALDALHAYAAAGGRVFGTHYHYYWFQSGSTDFQSTATWTPDGTSGGFQSTFSIDTSFPKGQAFAEWLLNVGASKTLGKIDLTGANGDVSTINPKTTQQWIYTPASGGEGASAKYLTFNTPVGAPVANQCGRVVYSDLHVTGSGGDSFPSECSTGDLSPQEKALEFLFFDLSACVQDPSQPPPPPPVR